MKLNKLCFMLVFCLLTLFSVNSVFAKPFVQIVPDAYFEGPFTVDQQVFYYTTNKHKNPSVIGIYFKVNETGKYKISDSTTDTPFHDRWSGIQKNLYRITEYPSGDEKFSLIAEKDHNLRHCCLNTDLYAGEPLIVDLERDVTYLLLFNKDKHDIPGLHNMKVTAKFEKLFSN